MELVIPVILLTLIVVILLYTRNDKGKVLESFSLGEFLHQNDLDPKNTNIIAKINDFFDTGNVNGDGIDDNDGGDSDL